jgi:hypothetical protein
MSFQLNTPESQTVQVVEEKSFEASTVTCTLFAFSEDAQTMEFTLRWTNADKSLKKEKSYLITGEALQNILTQNAGTMLSLRSAIFTYAQSLGELGSGVDRWGQI